MSQGDDTEDKSHEPSQRKLEKAREKGEFPRSQDLTTAIAYGGFALSFAFVGQGVVSRSGGVLTGLISQADPLGARILSGPSAHKSGVILPVVVPDALILAALPCLAVLLSLIARRSFVFHGPKLAPKLDRISPLKTAKHKFGRTGLFEFAKSVLKLVAISACLTWFLWREFPDLMTALRLEPQQITALLARLCLRFLAVITGIALVFGIIDSLWQQADHRRKHRMSHKEMRDEHKEAEGDPAMKQKRRTRAQEIAFNTMLADVPKADVVIVNPTHYAVALQWDQASGRAPLCLAKGTDAIAARIRERAAEAGVPIHSDPPTARALYASLDIGQEVQPDHYAPVAAAIRYAEMMRARAKGRA